MRNAREWGLTGLRAGHETALDGLHPHLKSALEEAQSVLNWVVKHDEQNHITDIGVDKASSLKPYFFAALDKTGAKAQELGFSPKIAWLGEPVDLYEVPGGVVLTVGSTINAKVALALVEWCEVDPTSGYGDWETAHANTLYIFPTQTEAEAMLAEISKAVRTVRNVARRMDGTRGEYATKVKNAPAF